jgi:glycine cleavage system H protein
MERMYTTDHEWIDREGDTARVGITNFAQLQLGDIVFVQLPTIGQQVKKGDAAAVVESVKVASDIICPLDGEVVEINPAIVADPSVINADSEGKAWFFKIKIASGADTGHLLTKAAYDKIAGPI